MKVMTMQELDSTHSAQFWFFDIHHYNFCRNNAVLIVSPFVNEGEKILIVNARTLREVNHDLTKLI